jgi:heme-degrading monooxygenase HmoA
MTETSAVREIAQLNIKPGQEDAFAAFFTQAAHLLRGAKGCRSVELRRSVETPGRFWLLVEWDTVDNHIKDFVASPAMAEMGKSADFFASNPIVEHGTKVMAI